MVLKAPSASAESSLIISNTAEASNSPPRIFGISADNALEREGGEGGVSIGWFVPMDTAFIIVIVRPAQSLRLAGKYGGSISKLTHHGAAAFGWKCILGATLCKLLWSEIMRSDASASI